MAVTSAPTARGHAADRDAALLRQRPVDGHGRRRRAVGEENVRPACTHTRACGQSSLSSVSPIGILRINERAEG
jgi:hypothetical protein